MTLVADVVNRRYGLPDCELPSVQPFLVNKQFSQLTADEPAARSNPIARS
jgi:hypothetical protein